MPVQTENYGFKINGVQHVSGRECLEICAKDGILLDVRPEYELNNLFCLEQVFYCPYGDIKEHYEEIPRDRIVVVADAVGLRSNEVVLFLQEKGFHNVLHLAGGIVEWERDGLPVTQDKNRRLTGSCMCQLKRREIKK